MPSRRTVLRLLAAWVAAAVLLTGVTWFIRGGADGQASRRSALGVLSPRLDPGPRFAPPDGVLDSGVTGASKKPAAVAGLPQALAPVLADPRLGSRLAVSVRDAETGASLFARRADQLVSPASTAKLVTAVAVLAAYGPYHRFRTRVTTGATPDELVLVGSGDPTTALGPTGSYPGAARLDHLAAAVRKAGVPPPSRVVLDGSLFTGVARAPGWDSDIVSAGYAAPVCSLAVNGGRLQPTSARRAPRSDRPDLVTGRAFARMLRAPDAQLVVGQAAPDARTIATLDSPPLLHLVELMLRESDNVIADALARQVAVAKKHPATFAGAATAIRQTLAELGVDPAGDRLIDGSGLSRQNRVATGLLTQVLAVAAGPRHPELRGVLSGLPVAAYSGTLSRRFDGASATGAGIVRAKTGTLSGVSSLAGVVTTADGRLLTFAVVADGVPPGGTLAAEDALDRVATTLAGCGCAA